MENNIRKESFDLVNEIYQPLGYLNCMVSSQEMWDYAKARATEQVIRIKNEIPMYIGKLNPKWKKWDDIQNEIQKL